MLIDWFTVAAQVLNFIILVWLLKRFLYQPILNAIDAREKHITQVLADAAHTQQQADAANKEWQEKNNALGTEREALLAKARTDALQEQQHLMVQALQAADDLSKKRQAALMQEQQHLQIHLNQYARNEVFAIARKTLNDLADASLEQAMVKKFIIHLSTLSDTDKKNLIGTLASTQYKTKIISSASLGEAQQQKIAFALNALLQTDITTSFEVTSNAEYGIALIIGDQKIEWTIDNYLRHFEQGVRDLITQKISGASGAVDKPGVSS